MILPFKNSNNFLHRMELKYYPIVFLVNADIVFTVDDRK